MNTVHVAVKALRARLEATVRSLEAAQPSETLTRSYGCAVQAGRTLAYAERELERDHHREGLRLVARAAWWLAGVSES